MSVIPAIVDPEDFFRAGGALEADAPSYVVRQADADLARAVQRGEYCNVLAARQMGKSSLKSRTAQRLRESGVRVVLLDVTSGGTESGALATEQWYFGLLSHIQRQLRLAVDVAGRWEAHRQLNPVQRFSDFMRYVVLEEVTDPIVIFMDEIDSTLKLPFSDDFFAAVRALYNARADDPAYKRLTFVLLGVARPADLIKDRSRTPYNIGAPIDLRDFTPAEARALLPGLAEAYPAQAEAILARILYWTDGHPYLTQRLCLDMIEARAAGAPTAEGGDAAAQVDQRVAQRFFAVSLRTEPNLQYIQDQVETYARPGVLLRLYRRVYRGRPVSDEVQSLDHNQLKLIGLVKTEQGVFQVRNAIYRQVFDLAWVRANTPTQWLRVAVVGLSLLVLALLMPYAERARVNWILSTANRELANPTSAADRVRGLARLFRLHSYFPAADYDDEARQRFYSHSEKDFDTRSRDLRVAVM